MVDLADPAGSLMISGELGNPLHSQEPKQLRSDATRRPAGPPDPGALRGPVPLSGDCNGWNREPIAGMIGGSTRPQELT